MDIERVIEEAHTNAVNHGWIGNTPRPIPEHVALLHSEATEMFEAWRDGHGPTEFLYEYEGRTGADRISTRPFGDLDEEPGKPIGIPAELADVVIRACQMSGEYRIDLVQAIQEKMAYNATRPYKHGRVH